MSYPTLSFEVPKVPNFQPFLEPDSYRIAIIGEAPGEEEVRHGCPFIGPSGQLLDRILSDVGIDRRKCFVGNVCQVRPPQNEIKRFAWNGPEIQSGLTALANDLNLFSPTVCLLLGNIPLRAAKDSAECKISSWSGSIFLGEFNTPFYQRKCIPSFHPSGILRQWGEQGNYSRLKFAAKRALEESFTSDLNLPHREIITNLDAGSLVSLLDNWPTGLRCSIDLEGGLPHDKVNEGVKKDSKKRRHLGWRCVGLSPNSHKSYVIAWWKFNEWDHARVLQAFARLMARPDVPKVLQNSLYDAFVQAYGYGIVMRNVAEDTMLKGWEIYSELPKGLVVQASLYTREPHWKDEEMYESTGENLAIGCGKDTAVTLEICEVQDAVLASNPKGLAHYRSNVDLLNPALYMELRGILLDHESVVSKTKEVKTEIGPIGERLSELAGKEVRGPSGGIADKRLAGIMYTDMGFDPQYKKDESGQNRLTTDIEALLKLRRKIPEGTVKAEFLNGIIRHRHLEGLLETLAIRPDPDGRVRCAYNVVGTETGRFSCKQSPTGAGANMTTITKRLRHNYIADPGHDFFQCDLAGADGWTVASHCARLGDPTMLEDYEAGLKPAKLIGLLQAFGYAVNALDRGSLKYWCGGSAWNAVTQEIGKGTYDCAKRVQHGTNYLMGIPTMQTTVMKASFKETGVPIYMEHRTASQLQGFYLARYPGVATWHRWAEAQLCATGSLTSASGHTRIFFGPRFGKRLHDTLKEFLADEPQQNTTWATNLAMLRLWNDPANRVKNFCGRVIETCDGSIHYVPQEALTFLSRLTRGSLLIEPLHQVHDALCGQWPQFLRDWARAKVRDYFNNPLTIADRQLVIPFDGAYGRSWGEQPNPL